MIEKPSIPKKRIIECLKTHYGIDVTALSYLQVGADMNASVYKAIAIDTSYFVKLKGEEVHDLSLAITKQLHDVGMSEIILPINTNKGEQSLNVDNFTLIVYPFIDGQDGFTRKLSDAHWLTLGKALKQIHALEIPSAIQNQIRQETFSPKWREAIRLIYDCLESKSIVDDEIAKKLFIFMQGNSALIHRLIDNADILGQKLLTQSAQFVFCHADIHAGNVLIDNNDKLYIVDWDNPMMAPKERDLMFFGAGVGNVWNQTEEVALFYQGYGHTEINKAMLAYYRHDRIVEDIALYAQSLLFTSSGHDRAIMYQHFNDMFEPNGVVEIALKTQV